MQMPVIQLGEHTFYSVIIVRQGFPDAFRKTGVIDEIAQALACKTKVPRSVVADVFSRSFRPAPFW